MNYTTRIYEQCLSRAACRILAKSWSACSLGPLYISCLVCFLGSVAANEGLGGSVANSQFIRHIGCAWLITGFAVMFMLSSGVQEQNDSLVVPGNRVPYVATTCRDLCRYMLCLHGDSQDYHRDHSIVYCEAHTFYLAQPSVLWLWVCWAGPV
jgi:hypothetical protein